MLNCRYYKNKEEFLNQMTMEEKTWGNEEKKYTNYPPRTIQRFIWLSEHYWDENKNEPAYYTMDRGLFLSTIMNHLSDIPILESDLEEIANYVNEWKYK